MNKPLLAAVYAAARLGGVAIVSAGIACAQTPKPADPKDEKKEDMVKLEKFEVTGSHIKRTEIEGPSPITVISRQDIEIQGRTNLTDLLRDLPESGFTGINEGGTTAAVRGSTALNLRDLGANNTLVIVDGRRTAPTGNNSGGTVFVDLNRFPLAMIERIEVLKDGASAIYGADATAGVVNVILRKDYNGAEVALSYGNSFKTDVAEKNYSFFGGTSAGRLRATVGISYYERAALKATDVPFGANADLSTRYLAKDPKYASLVNSGFYDLRSGTGPQARVLGIFGTAVNGQNGVNIPGLAAGAAITRLPGTGGTVAGTLASATPAFTNPSTTGTGGQFNATVAATYVPQILTPQSNPSNLYNFQEWVWLTPSTERTGLTTNWGYDISNQISLYAQMGRQRNHSHIELAPSPISTAGDNQIFVPRTNYWNPFGVDLQFAFRPVDFGPRKADIVNINDRFVLGAKGNALSRWDWDVYYTYDYDKVVDTTTNAMSESRLRAALARSTPDALNIFGGPTFKNNPATLDSIRVTAFKGGKSTQDQWHGSVAGDLFEGPTGTISGALLATWRRETFAENNDPLSTVFDDIIGQVRLADPTNARRTVKAAAAELRAPLIKSDRVPFVYKADVALAARFEDFSDGYDSGVKPYYGLRYQPWKSLLLRGSYSQNFRAPTLPQLYGGVRESLPSGLPDLRRPQALTGDPFDGSATQRLVKAGGNPKLTPETAKVWSYGFVYDVPVYPLQGLSLGSSYFHLEQSNVITTTGTAFIRQNEVGGGTADLVVRDAGTETYRNNTTANINILTGPNNTTTPVAPGQSVTVPGRIQYIKDAVVNLAFQKVEGYDFEVNYVKRTVDYGRFSFRSKATYIKFRGFTRTVNPAQTAGRDGYPRTRMQNSLVWLRKEWTVGLVHNFVGPYGDFTRDGYEIDSYNTIGLQVGYDIPSGLLPFAKNTRIGVGVDNLMDKKPPLYYNAVGYDQSFISRPAGRFFTASVRKTF